ncbi:MAG TPA: hypothetical protein VM121_02250 [Acidimicrobiales bacterium]|nr:hypothetical protein [Acidimicrobiales bacterium]
MDDNEIRDALGKVAPAPPPATNDFEAILARAKRGRAQWLGLALVVALVAGPAAGLLVGLNIDDGKNPVTVASGNDQGSRRDAAVAPETSTASGSASAVAGSAGGFFGSEKLTPLFKRTTADGIAIRAYRSDMDVAALDQRAGLDQSVVIDCAADAPCPLPAKPELPDECLPTAMLRAELSNDAAVEPGYMSVNKLTADQSMALTQSGYFGVSEGSPAAWTGVHTSDAVSKVRVTFADGAVDEMAPVEGYSVLAHQIAPPPQPQPQPQPAPAPQPAPSDTPNAASPSDATQASPPVDPEEFRKATLPGGTVEALDASGAVMATTSLTDAGAPVASCMVAPPAPGPFPIPAPDQVPAGGGVVPGERPAATIEPFPAAPAPPVTTAS